MNVLCPLLLSIVPAMAAPGTVLLDWSQLGSSAAREDAQARGPELLHAGPGGRLALYDGVRREVMILQDAQPVLSFPVHHARDLLLLDAGVLVLDHSARQLSLWGYDGDLRSMCTLPALVPTAVRLRLEGDQVLAVDPFGHGHPAATLRGGDLSTPVLRRLQVRPDEVRWDGDVMWTEGFRLELPQALEASGQRLGDWLVVDVVVGDAPIRVTRTAWHIPSKRARELPVDGRLYAPRGDLALSPEGALVVLVPWAAGLELRWVSP
jgi:hypothetical protein